MALGDRMEGLLVQRMVQGGVEMMLGAIHDPSFGHVVVCGSGGVLIELLADSACRLHPVTDHDAADMVGALKGVRLLRGFRGKAPVDEAAFRDAVLRISALVGICPEIEELDVNPLSVLPEGVSALDVRVRIRANALTRTLSKHLEADRVGHDEVTLVRVHGQYRARRCPSNEFSDAAHQEMLDGGLAMNSQHDKINRIPARQSNSNQRY